ncbi:hypothetical protein AAEI02_17250 [Shewanella xiamenensis]
MELSIGMEVTVGGMDAAVEPIGIYLRRVTGITVLNLWPNTLKHLSLAVM